MKYYCSTSNNLPSVPSLNVSMPYDFSGKGFSVLAPTTGSSTDPNYFYSINITINPPSPTSIASLHATLGYRFLQGDLSIMLEVSSLPSPTTPLTPLTPFTLSLLFLPFLFPLQVALPFYLLSSPLP
jgi:hypothetical protein